MSTDTLYNFLEKVEIFRDLDAEELKILLPVFEERPYAQKGIIFEPNTIRKRMYVVQSGEVELYQLNAFGEEHRLVFFGPGEFFGEGALLDDYPHATFARATQPSILLAINRDAFNETGRQHPRIAAHVIASVARVISRRMRLNTPKVNSIAAQYISGRTRTEHDLLGDKEVPAEAYYGVQTMRGLENFSISGMGLSMYPKLIEAFAAVKMAAALANHDLGLISDEIRDVIVQACREILGGKWHTQFVVDLIQGGAGTSTNMNANEVIANRALELLGHEKGEYKYCHPNNHVNLSQSTNDAYPTALCVALIWKNEMLVKTLKQLIEAFRDKAQEFSHILKMGRTQLQDAVPMTLGQTFGAYASTLREEIERLEQNAQLFLEVNMGGTAIGTGINAEPEYSEKVIQRLREVTGLPLVLAPDLIEATSDTGAYVMYSSALKRLAVKLSKICNDLRLLSSGPRTGIGEIRLPAMQPGSSIMPGKVNPVIPEVMNQIAFKVIGNDLTVTIAAEAGQLELNVMEPVIVQSILESIVMLRNGMATLREKCVVGIRANEERCREMVQNSIGVVTALVPALGYEVCTELAREALESNKGVYDLILEKNLLTREALHKLLDPEEMVKPRFARVGG